MNGHHSISSLGVADLEAARSFYEAGARATSHLSVNWEPASSLRPTAVSDCWPPASPFNSTKIVRVGVEPML